MRCCARSSCNCGATACAILSRPAPSPDGTALALVRAAPDGFYRVVLKDLRTGDQKELDLAAFLADPGPFLR